MDLGSALRKYLDARLDNLVDEATVIEYADMLAAAVIESGAARSAA